jgi:hypothetical protein
MVGLGSVVLCPHKFARRSCTVYVQADDQVMGLCQYCKSRLEDLVSRSAGVDEVRQVMADLGYSPWDADRFAEDLKALGGAA